MFQTAKIQHAHGLQITYNTDGQTRNLFVYHESGKVNNTEILEKARCLGVGSIFWKRYTLFLQDLVLFEVTITCRIYKVAEFDTNNYDILFLFLWGVPAASHPEQSYGLSVAHI